MQRITFLQGSRRGRDLVIVGGGFSVETFQFAKLPIQADILTLNDSLYFEDGYRGINPTWMMFYDANMLRVIDKMNIPRSVKVIGYNNSMHKRIDYDYNLGDIKPAKMWDNLAVKALIVAKNILEYDCVFLIGIDFTTREVNGKTSSHYQGEGIGKGLKYSDEEHFKTHLKNLEKRTEEFEKIKDLPGVYNCNPESKLTFFNFKLPY